MDELGTREQILLHSARLFGLRGFFGTSTRDIADGVGIRQPSLFYHFPAKHLILAELVDADLAQSMVRLQEMDRLDGSWSERLHFFIAASTLDYLAMPYDARGYYADALFSEVEFEPQREKIRVLHTRTRELIESGIAAGELIAVDAEFVRRTFTGAVFEVMRERETVQTAPVAERPLQLADFMLRAILADPGRLPGLRRRTEHELRPPIAP